MGAVEEGGGWQGRLGPALLRARTEGHAGLLEFLEVLGSTVEVEGARATVHTHLLTRAIDGHRLVLAKLGELMVQEHCANCPEAATNKARITVTFDPLFDAVLGRQVGVVEDLVGLLAMGRREVVEELFHHPVIQCLVLHKWRAYKVFFVLRSRLFMAFTITYSAHVRTCLTTKPSMDHSYPDSVLVVGAVACLWLLLTSLTSTLSSLCSLGCRKPSYSPLPTQEKEEAGGRWREERRSLMAGTVESGVTTVALLLALTSLTLALLPSTPLATPATTSTCTLVLEVVLLFLTSLLLLREGLHLVVVVRRLLQRACAGATSTLAHALSSPDTWLVGLALLGAGVQVAQVHLHLPPLLATTCQGLVATGLCSSWLHMVFLLGQPSHSFLGDFIVMFYNTFRLRLWSYVKIVGLFLIGFNLTFWSLQMSQNPGSGRPGGFADFWLGLARTGTMAIGELDVEEFSSNFSGAATGDAAVSRAFALLLLCGFTITGTVVLVSLLVASIVRDYKEMKAEVDLQNVQFMAHFVVRLEAALSLLSCFLPKCVTNIAELPLGGRLYCPHVLCSRETCGLEGVPGPREGVRVVGASRSRRGALARLLRGGARGKLKCSRCGAVLEQ